MRVFVLLWVDPLSLTFCGLFYLPDFTAAQGITQQMLTTGVASQAAYNLAAQQNLQSQFQAQQMAAATMQVLQLHEESKLTIKRRIAF